MVDLSSQRIDRVFHALADSTRRQMLGRLVHGEATVSTLADPFEMSLAAASKHLRVLASAELIEIEKRGRSRVCSLRPEALKNAASVIEHYQLFWNDRLDALEDHLGRSTKLTGPSSARKSEKQSKDAGPK